MKTEIENLVWVIAQQILSARAPVKNPFYFPNRSLLF